MTDSRALGWAPPIEIDGITLLQRNGWFETGTPAEPAEARFTKLVGFWVPRRWLTTETMDVDGVVAEIEEIVSTRGLIA